MVCNLSTQGLGQEDKKFEASQGYIDSVSKQTNKQTNNPSNCVVVNSNKMQSFQG
jgi:hypothetical protein